MSTKKMSTQVPQSVVYHVLTTSGESSLDIRSVSLDADDKVRSGFFNLRSGFLVVARDLTADQMLGVRSLVRDLLCEGDIRAVNELIEKHCIKGLLQPVLDSANRILNLEKMPPNHVWAQPGITFDRR